MIPRAAGRTVPAGDVVEPPADLGGRVVLPVGAVGGHLVAGQRLRDAVGTGRWVVGVDVPATLAIPERSQALHLADAEPAVEHHRAAERAVPAVAAARRGHRRGVGRRRLLLFLRVRRAGRWLGRRRVRVLHRQLVGDQGKGRCCTQAVHVRRAQVPLLVRTAGDLLVGPGGFEPIQRVSRGRRLDVGDGLAGGSNRGTALGADKCEHRHHEGGSGEDASQRNANGYGTLHE